LATHYTVIFLLSNRPKCTDFIYCKAKVNV